MGNNVYLHNLTREGKLLKSFVIYKSYNIGIPFQLWVHILKSNDYQPPPVCFQVRRAVHM